MNARRFTEAELEALHEPTFQPHLHRMWMGDTYEPPSRVVEFKRNDGTTGLLLTSDNDLRADTIGPDAAVEGAQFREPAAARVPRHRATVNVGPLVGVLLVLGLGLPALFGLLRWAFQ